jgi:starch phosphorylase
MCSGAFSSGDRQIFQPICQSLLSGDPFMVMADFASYADCHKAVARASQDEEKWSAMSIMNVAHMGWFSSDRAVREYAERIWKLRPVSIGSLR